MGYSNKGNAVLNLLRDDVGARQDISNINHEITYSRGVILAGEYVVNLHYYANHTGRGGRIKVPVHVWVSVKQNSLAAPRIIVDRTLTMERVGDEKTVFRFSLERRRAVGLRFDQRALQGDSGVEGLISAAFVGWVVATSALAFSAIGAPIHWGRRLTLVAILPISLGLGGWIMMTLMTGPKPHYLEWRDGETSLLAHTWIEGEAIFLWVRWPDEDAPRAYRLPWNEETAEQIEKAQEAVEAEGGETVVEFEEGPTGDMAMIAEAESDEDLDFEFSLEDRQPPTIYALPQPVPPAKPSTEQAPVINFGNTETDERS